MMTKTDWWAKSCLADTLAEVLSREVRKLVGKKASALSPEMQNLIRQAYRQASGLSASLNRIESMTTD